MTQPKATYTQLHIGLGSFHRAHQAVYLQALFDQGDTSWQIVGGNIRPDMAEVLTAIKAQGGYTLETVTPKGERTYQYIESIKYVVHYDAELEGLTTWAVDPATRIISFTVTEAGYYLDGNDDLDASFDDIASDLSGRTCCTIYGALARLLEARRVAEAGPVTLLNCDNLRCNGQKFTRGLKQFLTAKGMTELLAWVEENTTSPDSMVDRITPRPNDEVRERVLAATGRDDGAALMGESFIQWVVEDHFIAGRPAWETVGVEMVKDVMPYEEAKIRILNASHSCIAWAGALKGYDYIHQGTLDPEIRQLAYDYVTDTVIPALTPCPLDLEDYRDVVLDRFGNPNIQDTNQRVAMDGYSKLPGFLVPTLRDCIAQGRDFGALANVFGLFLKFLQALKNDEIRFEYQDQAMDLESFERIVTAQDPIEALVNEALLFQECAGDEQLFAALKTAYQRLPV
ncbi:MAG: D-arabinitol 4-dehydrogenase [Pontibacterium sp.]